MTATTAAAAPPDSRDIVGARTASGSARGESRLQSLELGRAVAALAVCLYHVEGFCVKYYGGFGFGNFMRGGYSGVEYFFVLSGFIIAYIHRNDIGDPARLSGFLKKRLIRIYPMYWLVTVPLAAIMLLHASFGADRHLTSLKAIADLLLIPRDGTLILPPAWTLHRELFFYALFALAILHRRWGMTLLILWQMVCLLNAVVPFTDPNFRAPINVALGFHNVGFGLGILAFYLFQRAQTLRRFAGIFVAVGGLIYVLTSVAEWSLSRTIADYEGGLGEPTAPLLYFSGAFLIVLGLVLYEKPSRASIWTGLVGVLGGASYLLYLIHEPATSMVFKVLASAKLRPLIGVHEAYWITIAVAVMIAVVLHIVVEKPLLRELRKRLLGAPGRKLSARPKEDPASSMAATLRD